MTIAGDGLAPGLPVVLLLRCGLIDPHTQRLELQTPHLVVDLGWNRVNAGLPLAAFTHQLLHTQRLERERHIHHRSGMAFGGRQVDHPSVGQQVQPPPVG